MAASGACFRALITRGCPRTNVPHRRPPFPPLPGPVISEEYHLEYGTDRLEMHVGAVQPGQRVLLVRAGVAARGRTAKLTGALVFFQPACLTHVSRPVFIQVDDLIATGGTLLAGTRLMERAGATVRRPAPLDYLD